MLKIDQITDAAKLGIKTGFFSIFVQVVVWIIIASLEFIGLVEIQRMLLGEIEWIYKFPMQLFLVVIPVDFGETGDILGGFCGLAFSILVFSTLVSIVSWFVVMVAVCKRNHATTQKMTPS